MPRTTDTLYCKHISCLWARYIIVTSSMMRKVRIFHWNTLPFLPPVYGAIHIDASAPIPFIWSNNWCIGTSWHLSQALSFRVLRFTRAHSVLSPWTLGYYIAQLRRFCSKKLCLVKRIMTQIICILPGPDISLGFFSNMLIFTRIFWKNFSCSQLWEPIDRKRNLDLCS